MYDYLLGTVTVFRDLGWSLFIQFLFCSILIFSVFYLFLLPLFIFFRSPLPTTKQKTSPAHHHHRYIPMLIFLIAWVIDSINPFISDWLSSAQPDQLSFVLLFFLSVAPFFILSICLPLYFLFLFVFFIKNVVVKGTRSRDDETHGKASKPLSFQ